MSIFPIPDDLFGVIRGTSGACGVLASFLKIGNRGEPISWERVGEGMRWKGGEVVIKRGGVGCSFRREGVLKRSGYWQVERGERSRCDRRFRGG